MKYTELKNSLKSGVKNAYLIYGEDRYLCFDALKKIEDSASLAFADMNSVTIAGESAEMDGIIDSANIFPFGDNYRIVVVKNYNPAKDAAAYQKLQNYLDNPLASTILVFFNFEGIEFFKGLKNLETIDCSKIDTKTIALLVKNKLAHQDIKSNDEAIEKLILYCSNDMTRIINELEKISAYVADTKILTPDIVEKNVVRDREYQIFELSNFIMSGDAKAANDMIDSMMVKSGDGFKLLAPLYASYRRSLFVAINKEKSPSELASKLGVSEYAIKLYAKQSSVFSIKQLKRIVDDIAEFERKVKMGEMKEQIAIKTVVLNILNIRGK